MYIFVFLLESVSKSTSYNIRIQTIEAYIGL